MNGAALLFIVLALAAIGYVAFTGSETLRGGDMTLVIQVLIGLTAVAIVGGGLFGRGRREFARSLLSLAAWLAIALVLVAGYAYRFEAADVFNRVTGSVVPGFTVTGRGGEVTISRSSSGGFIVRGLANDMPTRFIFDTGASTVVLKADDAERLGIRVRESDFTVGVSTANGRTRAAPVMLDELTIGGITERRVPALVARPGALGENLLGMTFLERLASYEVRGDRLIMRGRGI